MFRMSCRCVGVSVCMCVCVLKNKTCFVYSSMCSDSISSL